MSLSDKKEKYLELINKEGWTKIEHYKLTDKSNYKDVYEGSSCIMLIDQKGKIN